MAKGLGSQLQRARKAKGLSQQQVANLLGLSVGIISRYERDEDRPRLERLLNDLAPLLELDGDGLRRRYYRTAARSAVSS